MHRHTHISAVYSSFLNHSRFLECKLIRTLRLGMYSILYICSYCCRWEPSGTCSLHSYYSPNTYVVYSLRTIYLIQKSSPIGDWGYCMVLLVRFVYSTFHRAPSSALSRLLHVWLHTHTHMLKDITTWNWVNLTLVIPYIGLPCIEERGVV